MSEIHFPHLTPESLTEGIQQNAANAFEEKSQRGSASGLQLPGVLHGLDAMPPYDSVSQSNASKLLKEAVRNSSRHARWPGRLFRNQPRIDDLLCRILEQVLAFAQKFDAAVRHQDKVLRQLRPVARVLHLSVTDLQRDVQHLLGQAWAQSQKIQLLTDFCAVRLQENSQADKVNALEREIEKLNASMGHMRREMRSLREELAACQIPIVVPGPENGASTTQVPVPGRGGVGSTAASSLYVSFEDQFRGAESLVMERVKIYRPYVERAWSAAGKLPALDLGCGRGEWLSVLGEWGFPATGVDINGTMVEACREKGLSVTRGDLLSHLASIPAGSQSIVTAFHVVEHLSFDDLATLLMEVARVLAPGGLAVFETPNAANLHVSTYSFHYDPTHRNPLPAPLLKFLCESSGFVQVETLQLNPCPESEHVPVEGAPVLAQRFNQMFYGAQDIAALAWTPTL